MRRSLLLVIALWALVLEPTFGVAEEWERGCDRCNHSSLPSDGPRDDAAIDQPYVSIHLSIDVLSGTHTLALFDSPAHETAMGWTSDSNAERWISVARMRGGGWAYAPSDLPLRI